MGRRDREVAPHTAEDLLLPAAEVVSNAAERILALVRELGEEEKRWKTTVGREVARHWFAGQLQKDCQAICKSYKTKVKDVFEKWQCHLLISAGPEDEPLLEAPSEVDRSLLKELEDDIGEQNAERCLRQLYETAERAKTQFLRQQWNREAGDKPVVVEESGRGASLDMKCGKLALKINRGHLEKLLSLHDATERLISGAAPGGSEEQRRRTAMGRIGSLLVRYEALAGGGYQAALNGACFLALQEHWGVAMECFASPLNCRFPRFCSAFPDTDVWFGSSGSFFEFMPTSGSFEANPPFVPSVVEAMTAHMETLLTAAEARNTALSFIIVIPTWRHTEGWKVLNGGRFLRHHLLLRQKEHSYCEGSQHKRWKQAHRMSSCDTSVFWWQSAAAASTWPVTEGGLHDLRVAFASTLSDTQRSRCHFVSGTSEKFSGAKRMHGEDELPVPRKRARVGESDLTCESSFTSSKRDDGSRRSKDFEECIQKTDDGFRDERALLEERKSAKKQAKRAKRRCTAGSVDEKQRKKTQAQSEKAKEKKKKKKKRRKEEKKMKTQK